MRNHFFSKRVSHFQHPVTAMAAMAAQQQLAAHQAALAAAAALSSNNEEGKRKDIADAGEEKNDKKEVLKMSAYFNASIKKWT